MSIPYTIKHIGINNANPEEAAKTAALLSSFFGLPKASENDVNIFIGTLFEVMKDTKPDIRGAHGHIALQTPDVEAAMKDLASKGITFQENTIRRDENGRITFVYLEQQVAGFAFHLTV